jgi:choice-of-anchor A domain-containing protein
MKRILSILVLALLAFAKADAHNVQYYTSCGYVCAGSNMTVDAQIANAGSSTRYAWQYKDNSGTWKCFVNGSNTINGTSFTVSGASASGVANDAPLLTIQSAATALENVQVRVLMTDGGDPCATNPAYSVWGGDADPDNKYISLRLHVLSGSDCGTISTYCAQGGCNGNTMNDANGYFGGFEATNNWSSASTSYTEGGSTAGQYKVLNNVRSVQSSYPAFAPRSGNYMLYVNGSTVANTKVWYKSVSVTAGSTYQFSAWVANANNASTNLPYVQLLVDGTLVATGTVTSTAGDWDFVQGTYDATTTGTITIQIVDANIQSGNNDFVLDDICFKSLGATTLTCGSGYFNPFGPAEGFNVFTKNGITFQQGHTDAGVAMGGDATMNGNVNLALLQTGAYPYGAGNTNNYGIVIGGKMVYTSGQQSTVNNGFFRLGNTTNSRLFYQDCNNANTNFKVTPYNADCNTAFNSQPQLALQRDQTTGSATDPHGLDFTTAFTSFQNYANYMVQYTASSSCSNNLNIISLGSGNVTVTLVDNKINVINLTASQLNAITSMTFSNAPSATKPVVFNIDATATFTWSPFSVGGLANANGAYMVYNFYNNTGTITLTGGNQVFGAILAPGATFVKNHSGNTEGQIVAASFVLNGGEVHYQPFNVCLPICTGSASCTKTSETIPNQFNTGFGAPLTNSTFTGSTGTWTVNSNAQATAVCVQPYYNPSSSYAIKITNWNTSGKSAGSVSVASPKIDLSSACCPTELTFNFTLWTYTCVSGDANAALEIDFSSDNGSTWTEVWSKTSAQLFTLYGANGKTGISIAVPTGYQTANFKYRFRGEMAGNNANNFYQFIDDIYISSPTTCTPNLTLGNLVWLDTDNDGLKDANEQGLSGFTVKLYKDSNADNVPDGAAVATTTTNASGVYSFTGLSADKYIVAVVMPTGYTVGTTIASSSNPNNDTDNDNNGITLTSGEVRSNYITLTNGGEPTSGITNNTLDFGLKGTGSIGDFVWFDIDNDGIQEVGETGIANATVILTFPDGTTKTTTTDANGAYSFANLAPGTYSVAFTTPSGYFASAANQGADDTKDSDPVSGVTSVVLTAGQSNTTIDAGFYQKLNLGNSVWFDVNNNGLKDANEPGISGVTVKLYADANVDNIPDGAAVATTTTNASGEYSFTNLAPNKYIVGVTLPTNYTATVTTANSSNPNSDTDNDNNGITTVSGELRSNYITLSYGGEPASGIDGDATNGNLTLDFGLKGSMNLGNLVWNDANNNGIKNISEVGITGVTVYLYQDANADNVPDAAAINSTTTTAGGIYAFSNLVPGNYIVGIVTPTGYTNSYKPTNNANPNSDVDNDNNGVAEYSGIIRSNYLTLTIGGEPALATDGDGTNGNLTLDFAVIKDTDGDEIPDIIDIDDDNDGITDMNESGGYDPLADCDGDGIPNYMDLTPGCTTPSGNDPWGKAYIAITWVDCNTDGINDFFDWDRDGIINELDLDSDNDGILDVQEARPGGVAVTATANGMITGTDADANGLLSSYENGNSNPVLNGIAAQDLDRDGTPNFLDLDSDGDGMTDLTEALNVYSSTGVLSGTDSDGDGVRSETFGSSAANVADNINGFGAKGFTLLNSDATIAGVSTGDTYPNVYDIDSDNDGITDNVEAQATCSYKVPMGTDCDGDGVDDAYDATSQCVTCTRTSAGLTPFDKDGDGTPDYLDLDTDNDGAWDIYEGHTISTADGRSVPTANYWIASIGDVDKDGLLDYFDNFNINTETVNRYGNATSNNMGANGSFSPGVAKPGSIVQLPESDEKGGCAGGGERDWRTVTILPVKLLEFKGNLAGNNVNLSWTVANETNMNGYEVERSVDAVSFTKVSTVKATAAISSNKTYTAADNIASLTNNKVVYYRLKQLDVNGSYKYSNTINFRLNSKGIVMAISPNPAVSFVNIKLNVAKDGLASIKVTDMIGRTVSSQNTKVSQGVNSIAINNISNFSAGTYNIQVMVDGEVFNEKLIVTK